MITTTQRCCIGDPSQLIAVATTQRVCVMRDSEISSQNTMQAFVYNAIATGSNFAPISFELRDGRTGQSITLTGSTVAVTVRDEQTGELILDSAEGAINSINPAIAEFYFADVDVAKITIESTWLVEWKITAANTRVFRNPVPCRLPVRLKL